MTCQFQKFSTEFEPQNMQKYEFKQPKAAKLFPQPAISLIAGCGYIVYMYLAGYHKIFSAAVHTYSTWFSKKTQNRPSF